MKKEQIANRTKLQFTRKAVAKLGRAEVNVANLGYPYLTTLITFTQQCCGGEDSSRPISREVAY